MKIFIPEIRGIHRLGRHINHDPRSLRYVAPPATADVSVMWARHIPILDQGNLGSCTGNAECGQLGTDPIWPTLTPDIQSGLNEDFAIKLYSEATKIDPYQGTYPPTDTGSDGLSVSKAAKAMNLISGYVWATSVDSAKTLIQQGPIIIGSNWTTNMDKCPASGIIVNPAGGSVRGGHEYECFARDAENDLWWFCNSWGPDWGKSGTFAYNSAGFAALLAQGGDVTQSVPLTEPPPNPNPTDPDLVTWWQGTEPWAVAHDLTKHSPASSAAKACITLAAQKGL